MFIRTKKLHIIHKDLHFANLILDEKRYISLIDFHISMEYKDKNQSLENHHSLGTRKICPPEMLERFVYDFNPDYYRLGALLYYILFGKYPTDVKQEKNITN